MIPKTVADALKQWDSYENVSVIEMGGLGPGYEMQIQALAFEFLREYQDSGAHVLDWENTDRTKEIFDPICDAVIKKVRGKPWAGFSGAQVGAALNIASCVLRRGYKEALSDLKVQDRLISVNKLDLRGEYHPDKDPRNGGGI